AMTQVIWDSYVIWSPTAWLPFVGVNGFSVFTTLLADTFTHMMLYEAPFIAVLLLLEFGVALLGLYSPQLQVSTLA
ncbi:EscT/YscT/HrcT family type III secretion system export apparatus protein, partial [Bacillus toyonensis]